MSKRPTAAIAREILRRENGYEPDTSIDLSEYGYDENTIAESALRDAAQLPAEPVIPVTPADKNNNDNAGAIPVTPADKKNEYANDIFNNDNPYYNNVDAMEKPEYTSAYDDKINSLVDSILNGEKFSYDVNEDALFQNYASIYERNARLAAENAMGNAMSASGGYGNSYAAALADQAYNSQMQGLNEVVPELQQLAYAQYQNEKNEQYDQLNMLNAMENQDYSKYRDDVSDYYTDINTQLGLGDRYNADLMNKFNVADQLENEEYNRDYQAGRDAIEDERWNKQFEYGKEVDTYNRELNEALIAAESGNYSGLSEILGIDMSDAENWFNTQRGIDLYAATGVVDYLKNAGIDTSVIEKNMQNEEYRNSLAIAMSVYEATGSPDLLQKLGINTSYMDEILKYSLMSAEKSANGTSGRRNSGEQVITQKVLDSAKEALNIGGESNLYNYLNNLASKGYTEDQLTYIYTEIMGVNELSDQGALDLLTGFNNLMTGSSNVLQILSGNGAGVGGAAVTGSNVIIDPNKIYTDDNIGEGKVITEEEFKKMFPATTRK